MAPVRVIWARPKTDNTAFAPTAEQARAIADRNTGEGCDQLIALPVRGNVESLNVSTAAAALVYGILQFRVQS